MYQRLLKLTNELAMSAIYTDWSDEFARKRNKEILDKFYKEVKENDSLDITKLNEEQAITLGFSKMTINGGVIYLVPLYLVPVIPQGTKLIDVFGLITVEFNSIDELDLDTRFGCISRGILIED